MADDTVEAAIKILRGDQNLYEAHVWTNALRVVCDAAAVRAENAQEKLAEALLALPRRLEPISGQTFSYIKLDDALALVGYPPYPPTS